MTAKNGRQEPYPVWHFKNIKERGVWGGVVRASAPLGEPLALYPRRCSKRRGPAGPPNAQAPSPRTANVNYQPGPAWAQTLSQTRPCLNQARAGWCLTFVFRGPRLPLYNTTGWLRLLVKISWGSNCHQMGPVWGLWVPPSPLVFKRGS